MAGTRGARCRWLFGSDPLSTNLTGLKSGNVVGSTGAGAAYNTHGFGTLFSFYAETDAAATCSYQIRTARTSSGPWAVLSSGTMGTSATDIVQLPGPFRWISPRIKTLNSTANTVFIEMTAEE